MKGIIDRFEGEFAIVELEDRRVIDVHRNKLPKEAKEGDFIIISNKNIVIDKEETKKIKKEIEELTKDIWE